ncbi:SURF1 family protein [Devosia sp.]|uniref:SURF1 family protein n=1 Tax=Devosia sp. TaxID=1871048 RepID=UPI003A92B762
MNDAPVTAQAARPRANWPFVVFMLVLMAIFIALGTWQIARLGEKEALIEAVESRLDLQPIGLPPSSEWAGFDPEPYIYRTVNASGTWLPDGTVLVFTSLGEARGPYSGPGYWVMTPLALSGGGTVFVNQGFVPQASGSAFAGGGPLPTGPVTVRGVVREAERPSAFTPGMDGARRIDWIRDPQRLAGLAPDAPRPIAPVFIDLPAGGEGALPQGGETRLEFPNNHLGYAITWFGFAILVPILLWFWFHRQRSAA